ncbi:MAG: protein phosphatase 2C domain-containing protein [Lachnospiraceae bacterium]|nr:protein phosphatase 2C domain-containing protein [Lachnospiraceae bacterium]
MWNKKSIEGYHCAYAWEKGNSALGEKERPNGDACGMEVVEKEGLFRALAVVSDGISTLDNPAETAGFVVTELSDWFYETLLGGPFTGKRLYHLGHQKLYEICHSLREKAEQKMVVKGYGCSASFVLLEGAHFVAFSSGITRIYVISRDGGVKRLSHDDARGKKQLKACIGSFGYQEAEFIKGKLKKGEALLVCSSGFSGAKDLGILGAGKVYTEEMAERRLRELAKKQIRENGGEDATAVWIRPVSFQEEKQDVGTI